MRVLPWEVWIWNGEVHQDSDGWTKTAFADGDLAEQEYQKHIRVMPNCPAKFVEVKVHKEHSGKTEIRERIQAYLDEYESHGLIESDSFLTGLDVTFEAAKGLLEDFAIYVEQVEKSVDKRE